MNKSYRRVPRFSLIIPAYNEETYLARLLNSVDTVSYTHLTLPTSDLV